MFSFVVRKTVNMKLTDVDQYLEQHKREYITDKFEFASYCPPNTMYHVSNELDELLLTMSNHAIRLWHRTMSRVKRNTDPVRVVTIQIEYRDYKDILSRNYFYSALKELCHSSLLLPTDQRSIYVVNLMYANKLFKPKLDI